MKPTATQCIVFPIQVLGTSPEVIQAWDTENEKQESGSRLLPTETRFLVRNAQRSVKARANLGFGPGGFSGFDLFEPNKPKAACLCNAIHNETTKPFPNRLHPEFHRIQVLFTDKWGIYRLFDLSIVADPQIGFQAGSRLDLSGTVELTQPQFIHFTYPTHCDFRFITDPDTSTGFPSARNQQAGAFHRGVERHSDRNAPCHFTMNLLSILNHTPITFYSG